MGLYQTSGQYEDRLTMVIGSCGHLIEDYASTMTDGQAWCVKCDHKVTVDREVRFTLPNGRW